MTQKEQLIALRAYHAVLKEQIAHQGQVGTGTMLVLMTLATHRGITMGELARIAGISTAAITGVALRLERDGIARRELSAENRRNLYMRLTPKGQSLVAMAQEAATKELEFHKQQTEKPNPKTPQNELA